MATENKTGRTLGPLQVGMVVAFAEHDNHGAHGKKTAIELDDRTGETVAYIIKPEHVALFSAAPDMLAALKVLSANAKEAIAFIPTEPQDNPSRNVWHDLDIAIKASDRAIAKAEK